RSAGGVIEVEDDLPYLLFGEAVFPCGHDRVPRRGFLREPRPAFRDSPEEVGLLEHRDGARVLEVRRRRFEAVREVAFPVEVVAVAVHAVADVGLSTRGGMLGVIRGVLPQRIVEAGDLDLLAAALDGRR